MPVVKSPSVWPRKRVFLTSHIALSSWNASDPTGRLWVISCFISSLQCPRCMQCDTKFDFIRRKVCFVLQRGRDTQRRRKRRVKNQCLTLSLLWFTRWFFPLPPPPPPHRPPPPPPPPWCLCALARRHTEASVLTFSFPDITALLFCRALLVLRQKYTFCFDKITAADLSADLSAALGQLAEAPSLQHEATFFFTRQLCCSDFQVWDLHQLKVSLKAAKNICVFFAWSSGFAEGVKLL